MLMGVMNTTTRGLSTLPLALLTGALAVALTPSPAWASDCGNVTSAGTCLDSKTLVWCDAGALETMVCPAGEVCVAHEHFGGSFGCIATQYTQCGEITEAGQCAAGDRAVVWCETDRVRARMCDEGLACAWVEDEGWFDCVAVRGGTAAGPAIPEEPEPPVEEEPDVSAPSDDVTDASGPVPEVEKGGAAPRGAYAGGGGGACSGADPTAPLALALAGLALFALRRARREPVRVKRRPRR